MIGLRRICPRRARDSKEEDPNNAEVRDVEEHGAAECVIVVSVFVVEGAPEPATDRHAGHRREQRQWNAPGCFGRRKEVSYCHRIGWNDACKRKPNAAEIAKRPTSSRVSRKAVMASAW